MTRWSCVLAAILLSACSSKSSALPPDPLPTTNDLQVTVTPASGVPLKSTDTVTATIAASCLSRTDFVTSQFVRADGQLLPPGGASTCGGGNVTIQLSEPLGNRVWAFAKGQNVTLDVFLVSRFTAGALVPADSIVLAKRAVGSWPVVP